MLCWGSTLNGGLGGEEPNKAQLFLPSFLDFSESWNVKQVFSGQTHSLLLTKDGVVYSCGSNESGQLGHSKDTNTPERVDDLHKYVITQVSAGDQHSLALTSWGMIYAWGDNTYGQLGIPSIETRIATPHLIKGMARKQTVQVACGSTHSLALTADGEVYAWGRNHLGQLGLGHQQGPLKEPSQVTKLAGSPLVFLAAAGDHSAVLTLSGFLLTWGSNKHGQLGYTPKINPSLSHTPTLVPNLASYSEPIPYVALGEKHTAALDSLGKLWTFGNGQFGQLGHGNNDDCTIPRTVLDLVGSRVGQVACGRGHTLVYVPSQGQLFAFGQGHSGQLGIGGPCNYNLPQVVVGPWCSPQASDLSGGTKENKSQEEEEEETLRVYMKKIFAGGDVSTAAVSKEQLTSEDFCHSPNPSLYTPLCLEEEKINKLLAISEDELIDDDLFSYAETVFASMSAWNSSFLRVDASKHTHGLDYRLAEECVARLGRIKRESIQEVLQSGIQSVTSMLPSNPVSTDSLRCLVLLPLFRGFLDTRHISTLHLPYSEAVLRLSEDMLQVFRSWMSALPRDFMLRLVAIYKVVVVHLLNISQHMNTERGYRTLRSALGVLAMVHRENFKGGSKLARLSYEDFYIPEIAEKIDIRRDYMHFLNKKLNPETVPRSITVSFCEYPFLFDAQAKTMLLRCDATRQMEGAIREAVMNTNPMLMFLDPYKVQFLNIQIRRTNIVSDTISQLMNCEDTEYRKPLKVHFIEEEAEDAGGVRKEFFLLLMRDILNPDYGMFAEYPETRAIWFREGALESAATYEMIGIVCGLAIYNFTIIDLPFPLALYKKLLDETVGLDDLSDLDPHLTRSLRDLLEYEGSDVEDVYCLNFTITQNYYGEVRSIPLKPGGESIPVTAQNKQEYVDLLVDHKLNTGIESHYRAFHQGFYRVCGGIVLKLLQPIELMDLVTGNENYSWEELEKNTEYKGEYHAEHRVIKTFWEVFHELNLDQKKQFLKFLTGTDRVPIQGMKALNMIIESTGDDNFLPVAHTCVAQLDLPKYNTKEKLRYKLLQAIQQSEGFGLV